MALFRFGYIDQTSVSVLRDLYISFFYVVLLPIAGLASVVLGITFFAVKFVTNRAVGTLGIIIAGFGVLGEAYQLTTQLMV